MTDFGLDDLRVEDLKRRPGTKWRNADGRLAAWVADMDFPIAPAIRDRLVELARMDVGYPHWPTIGRSPLPERFASRMGNRFDWSPDVDRLHEMADVMQGVQVALHHLTRPGDGVIVHTPAYHPFLKTIAAMRRRLIEVPARLVDGRWGFDHDELDGRLSATEAKAMILCHPHNPTGHVFDRHDLERLAEIVNRHGLAVISDEVHAELVHPPSQHVPFAVVDGEAARRAVTVTSASKAFNLAGLRWAIMHAGNDELDGAMRALPDHYLGMPNLMGVAATESAWHDGDEWQRAVAERLDRNRQQLVGLLEQHLPGAVYAIPDASYLAWIDFRPLGLGDDPAEVMRARGVELSSGPLFGPGGGGFARLNFATSAAVLAHIVETMGGFDFTGETAHGGHDTANEAGDPASFDAGRREQR